MKLDVRKNDEDDQQQSNNQFTLFFMEYSVKQLLDVLFFKFCIGIAKIVQDAQKFIGQP